MTIPSAALRGRFPVSRAQGSLTFPANFMLVGAMNPCPCGYFGDPEHECACSPTLISRYQKRLSGPLIDRTLAPHASAGVDIHTEIPGVPFQKLSDERRGEPSAAIRTLVEAARARQSARFANVKDGQGASLTTNADMGPTQVRDYCLVDETGRQLLGAAMRQMNLTRGRITGCSSSRGRSWTWRGRSASSRRTSRRRSSIGRGSRDRSSWISGTHHLWRRHGGLRSRDRVAAGANIPAHDPCRARRNRGPHVRERHCVRSSILKRIPAISPDDLEYEVRCRMLPRGLAELTERVWRTRG